MAPPPESRVPPRRRVIAALSGGVDSAVAAALLKDAGFEVIGINMRLWPSRERPDHPCCGEDAVRDARDICSTLHIPFYVLDLEAEFRRHVFDYFTSEYGRGRTPNPCIACNQHLKFGFLMEHARALEADYLATGHYARITRDESGFHLLRASHHEKDQSYVLYTLTQEGLGHILFPLGGLSKGEVREIAREKHLSVAEKPDSQDLCFVYEHADHLSGLPGQLPGDIVDARGRVLGRHRGMASYTIGQRQGLGLGGGVRLYVLRIEAEGNRIVVGPEEGLNHRGLATERVNWISGQAPTEPIAATVKIRYRSPEAPATLAPRGDTAVVQFNEPQRAIAPGQFAVFYRGEEILGGGAIESVLD